MSLITIRKSHFATDLIVLRGKLESEGIKCFLKNELTTQIMNYLPSFEVELQIDDSDLERVKEILSEIEEE